MYLLQNIFGHNLLKFQFDISSLAIFILQSKLKKKYFSIFSSSQPITATDTRHVTWLVPHLFPLSCSPYEQDAYVALHGFFRDSSTE